MKRNDIVIIKQDKGRGVVIMDKSKYTEKGLAILSTKQFQKLKLDPTKSTEVKVQRMVRKVKSKLTIQEYKGCFLVVHVQESFMARLSYIKLIQKD